MAYNLVVTHGRSSPSWAGPEYNVTLDWLVGIYACGGWHIGETVWTADPIYLGM